MTEPEPDEFMARLGQADRVAAIARDAGWRHVELKQDLQRIPRAAVMKMS